MSTVYASDGKNAYANKSSCENRQRNVTCRPIGPHTCDTVHNAHCTRCTYLAHKTHFASNSALY